MLLHTPFEGQYFRLVDTWLLHVPYKRNTPIRYLEIGTFLGANAISVHQTYCKHPESEIHLIDPWVDYAEYDEYKGRNESHYEICMRNLKNTGHFNKFRVNRGFSHEVIPKYDNEYFDIIYVDGNHNPEFVLEDAVLAFRKLKIGGYLIFDDVNWPDGPDHTQRGIDAFLLAYRDRIENLGDNKCQQFTRKLS